MLPAIASPQPAAFPRTGQNARKQFRLCMRYYTQFFESQVESTLTITLILSAFQQLRWKNLWINLWISCGRIVNEIHSVSVDSSGNCGNQIDVQNGWTVEKVAERLRKKLKNAWICFMLDVKKYERLPKNRQPLRIENLQTYDAGASSAAPWA